MSERATNRRIRLLLAVFSVLFAVTLARAAWIQAVNGRRTTQWRRASTARRSSPAARGTIFDRTGSPLAIGEQTTTVYADPRLVRDAKAAAVAAGKALDLDPDELYPLLSDRSTRFVYVLRKADPLKAAQLERQKIPGFGFYVEELRAYPQGGVGAHVLGYAGVDNRGLEGSSGRSTRPWRGAPAARRSFATRSAARSRSSPPGRSGRAGTSSSRSTTRFRPARRTCSARPCGHWGAKGATAVVLDVRTGAVLAMANARRSTPTSSRHSSRAPAQSRRHGCLRTGVDVQARHDRGRARGRCRHARDPVRARAADPDRRPVDPRGA